MKPTALRQAYRATCASVFLALSICASGRAQVGQEAGDIAAVESKKYQDCVASSEGSPPVMRDCTLAETARLDHSIATLSEMITRKLGHNYQDKFRSEMASWEAYRNAHCEFEYLSSGGDKGVQDAYLAGTDCELKLVEERFVYLNQTLNALQMDDNP
jgi:hypothetical protein